MVATKEEATEDLTAGDRRSRLKLGAIGLGPCRCEQPSAWSLLYCKSREASGLIGTKINCTEVRMGKEGRKMEYLVCEGSS
jgi:hypothetical protein